MKKLALSLFALGVFAFNQADAAVVRVTVQGFREPGGSTASPAPGGGTTYTANCSPSGAICASYVVITQSGGNQSSTKLEGSYGVYNLYDGNGNIQESHEGYCKEIHYSKHRISITLTDSDE